MSARTAHIHPADRRPVLCIPRYRPIEQQLIESQLTLKNITLGEADLILDIPGGADFRMQDQALEIRTVARDGIDDRIAECLALRAGPLAVRELIRTILDEHRHVVLPIRR